ncbi:Neurotransmitter-gated ion-channel ligand binding domain protein [Teladorsagia circumcincta]|uniref:Neurotransmitter-gated ion-channel ligand binding domain protein n=1 Tax=Teladorsagia circumcincta TaxID=45464 RepID=A0A2G9UVA7_TELCI|nr:Neurotransmitter-gated ion-channel ligand binding domain protein [Teladorsagia circumcincta]
MYSLGSLKQARNELRRDAKAKELIGGVILANTHSIKIAIPDPTDVWGGCGVKEDPFIRQLQQRAFYLANIFFIIDSRALIILRFSKFSMHPGILLSVCAASFAWDSGHTTPSVEKLSKYRYVQCEFQLTSADYTDTLQDTSVAERFSTHFLPGSSKKLTEHLLSRHNVNAPPDGLLDVHYEMELVHILGIDELKQTMTVLVYVDEKWTDPSLSWDPALFGGIAKTWLPISAIWVPDIIIFNMLHHEDLLSSVRAPALIYPNGTVEASHPAVYTVTCEINIKRFPLDDQRCPLGIASWTYGKDKIRLRAHTEHSLQHYTDNEEWRLLKVTVIEDEYEHEGINVSELRYDVSVKRRPLFYMVTLTFPSYVMCAISVVGLFARFSTTGEREQGIYTVCSDSPLHSSSCLKGLNGELREQPIAERIPVLESYIRKLVHTCENIQGEIDDFDVDDPTAIRRRREANGYVRISERLDLFFMSFFLTLVYFCRRICSTDEQWTTGNNRIFSQIEKTVSASCIIFSHPKEPLISTWSLRHHISNNTPSM